MTLFSRLGHVLAGPPVEPQPTRFEGAVDPIAEIVPRTRARVYGVVTAIVVQSVDAPARFDIEIDDGTGRLTARWMGREHITGIDPGVRIEIDGFATGSSKRLLMFNPRYTIHGAKDSEL